jgi:hypothetical protein
MKELSFLIVIFLCMVFISSSLFAQDEEYKALKVKEPPKIDGDLGDFAWQWVEGIYVEDWEANGGTSKGPKDISMTLYVVWDDDNLYFAADVSDDEQLHEHTGNSIWNGDSIQLAIDPTGERNIAGFDNNSYEYNFGLDVSDNVIMSRLFGHPKSAGDNSELMIVRDDDEGKTYYELRIPADDIAPADFVADGQIGFGLICNDGDKAAPGQTGWVGWGSQAIVFGKDNTQMNLIIFSGEMVAVSPKDKLTATWGHIKTIDF